MNGDALSVWPIGQPAPPEGELRERRSLRNLSPWVRWHGEAVTERAVTERPARTGKPPPPQTQEAVQPDRLLNLLKIQYRLTKLEISARQVFIWMQA